MTETVFDHVGPEPGGIIQDSMALAAAALKFLIGTFAKSSYKYTVYSMSDLGIKTVAVNWMNIGGGGAVSRFLSRAPSPHAVEVSRTGIVTRSGSRTPVTAIP
jgi:hypothetical protein